MTESEWVKTIFEDLETRLQLKDDKIKLKTGFKFAYSNEILRYKGEIPDAQKISLYETDIFILEITKENFWTPRIVIEAKLSKVTTHDAITYSQKAQTHKNVHPYLRYGILIGDRQHHPLPGRLFRHGENFDFMVSWKTKVPDANETTILIDILEQEIEASRMLQEIIYNSRSKQRKKFTSLHKPLKMNK